MRPLSCDHLVVGAGSTGLAVADHLLRRNSGSVILLDRLESPQARMGESRVPLLVPPCDPPCDASDSSDWEGPIHRALELYEGWSNWLEMDPGYRRSGALVLSAENVRNGDWLESGEIRRRWSALGDMSSGAHFVAECGTVNHQEVLAALMWRLRKSGGRFHGGAALNHLEETSNGVHFYTSRRDGFAQRVYLCQGAAAPSMMKEMGVRHRQKIETVCEFSFDLSGDFPPLIHWPHHKATLFFSSSSTAELHMVSTPIDPLPGGNLPTAAVDWELLSSFRKAWGPFIPGFSDSVIRKARARHRRAHDADSLEVVSSAGGCIQMPAAAGEYQDLMFPALAEALVEQVDSGATGGLLEDLGD